MKLQAEKRATSPQPAESSLSFKHTDTAITLHYTLSNHKGIFKFLYDMVTRWTLPGKRAEPCEMAHKITGEVCTGHIALPIPPSDLDLALSTLPLLRDELLYGARSPFHATRMLEMKGIFGREKMELVQDRLAALMTRFPDIYDYDLLGTLHRFAYETTQSFRASRSVSYLARTIAAQYIVQKKVTSQSEEMPDKRYLMLKLIQTKLELPLGTQHTLALIISLNYLRENETFSRRHLLRAIQTFIPDAALVTDAIFEREIADPSLYFAHVEIVKNSGDSFTLSEIATLRRDLPALLTRRIESVKRSLLMPHNEEEQFRTMRALAAELKYKRDLPQIALDFEGQTDTDLIFTLLIACLDEALVETLSAEFSLERIRQVGLLRRRFPKKVARLKCHLAIDPYIRPDERIDIAAARADLLAKVHTSIGPVRDYNGGLLAKHAEALTALKKALPTADPYDLENFFEALFPIEYRSVISTNSLSTLYRMTREKNRAATLIQHDPEALIALLTFTVPQKREEMIQSVAQTFSLSSNLITLQLTDGPHHLLGYILGTTDPHLRHAFSLSF